MNYIQSQIDIQFLLNRSRYAGILDYTPERKTGLCANSLVSLCYGMIEPNDIILPTDQEDLLAAERTWKQIPTFRKTDNALLAMQKIRNAISVDAA